MSDLLTACKRGDLQVVKNLIKNGANPNQHDPDDGTTPLYWAAWNGHMALCDWLIRHGSDVNRVMSRSGSSALHAAADRGHAECVYLLIKSGAHIDACTPKNWDTPLHLASYKGHISVCRLLVENGAITDLENKQRRTPVQEAQSRQHYDVWSYLNKHQQGHGNGMLPKHEKQFCKTEDLLVLRPKKVPSTPRTLTSPLWYSDPSLSLRKHQAAEQDERVVTGAYHVVSEETSLQTSASLYDNECVNSSTEGQGHEIPQMPISSVMQKNIKSNLQKQKTYNLVHKEECKLSRKTQECADLKEEVKNLCAHTLILEEEIKTKDERIIQLELVNEQLKIYAQHYDENYQELRLMREKMEKQSCRAEAAEKEINVLRRRLERLQPKGHRLKEEWSRLQNANDSEAKSARQIFMLNSDEESLDIWGQTYQLTSRCPVNVGEDQEETSPQLSPPAKMARSWDCPVSEQGATVSHSCSHSLYQAIKPVFRTLEESRKDLLENSLRTQLQQVSRGQLENDFTSDTDCQILGTVPPKTMSQYGLEEEAISILVGEKQYLMLPNDTMEKDVILNIPYHENIIQKFVRYGICTDHSSSQFSILSRDKLPNSRTFYVMESCPLTLEEYLVKVKSLLNNKQKILLVNQLVYELSLGLHHIHCHGGYHGNINARTIRIDRQGLLRINTIGRKTNEEDRFGHQTDIIALLSLVKYITIQVGDIKSVEGMQYLPHMLKNLMNGVLDKNITMAYLATRIGIMLYGPQHSEVTCPRDCDIWLQAIIMKLLTAPWQQINNSGDLVSKTRHIDLENVLQRTDVILERQFVSNMTGQSLWKHIQEKN